jgi:hypothetical protein
MADDADSRRVAELVAALDEYRAARERLLEILGPRRSNRDPLAEFAALDASNTAQQPAETGPGGRCHAWVSAAG